MKANRNVMKCLTYISQFAINMLVPICFCSYIGYYIDKHLDTGFCFILLFFVGALAGGRNIYILSRRVFDDNGSRPSQLYASNRKKTEKSKSDKE